MTASLFGALSILLLASTSLPKLVVPNSPDVKITIKRTSSDSLTTVESLYAKGPRQRVEYTSERTVSGRTVKNDFIEIRQCDQRERISLNLSAKTYVQVPMEDWALKSKGAKSVPQAEMGPDVNVTIDSVDTGERKQFGSYVARHLKTTTVVEPSPGASTLARTEEVDGWYIDLPGLGCWDMQSGGAFISSYSHSTVTPARRDRLQIKHAGTAPHGFAVAEKIRRTEAGRTTFSEVALVELSEAKLDPALFVLPSGYSPALHNAWGGYDMTRPDTVSNRAQQYWSMLTRTVQGWLR